MGKWRKANVESAASRDKTVNIDAASTLIQERELKSLASNPAYQGLALRLSFQIQIFTVGSNIPTPQYGRVVEPLQMHVTLD